MSEWQPIDTAPKDGTPFIGAIQWDADEWEILRMVWSESTANFIDATYAPFAESQEQPTHWMPLPAPPAKGTKAA